MTLASRIESEFYELFASMGRMPGQGHRRKDLTSRPVLFFPLYSFPVERFGHIVTDNNRRDESRRGTHECVRHKTSGNVITETVH